VLQIPWPALALVVATVLMSQLSISALNDWADRERDAAAQRWRPVATGRVSPGVAVGLAVLFALGTLPGALAFGSAAAIVLVIAVASGWAYDLWLKPTLLSFLPFAVGFPLLPTWVVLAGGRSASNLTVLIIAGIFLGIAIHLADSLPDIESDLAVGMRNLAVVLQPARTVRVIAALILAGGLVVVAELRSRPLLAALIGVVALAAAAAVVRTGRTRPQHSRWISASFALVTALALVSRFSNA
jgi:4-hydroxybenzoate polyprenyltransferase